MISPRLATKIRNVWQMTHDQAICFPRFSIPTQNGEIGKWILVFGFAASVAGQGNPPHAFAGAPLSKLAYDI